MKREIVTILIASPIMITIGGIIFFILSGVSYIICALLCFIAHAYIICWPLIKTFNKNTIISLDSLSSVHALIKDPYTFALFKEFAYREFSVENPIFLQKLQEFKTNFEQTSTPQLREQLVMQIYNSFIRRAAVLELNIEHILIIKLENKIEQKLFAVDMFDEIEKSVLVTIQNDTWKRWTLSSEYKKIEFELRQSKKFNIL